MVSLAIAAIVPTNELIDSPAPFALAATKILGVTGGTIISIGALISTLGSLNANTLTAGNLSLAAARDGLLPRKFILLTKTGTPIFTYLLTGVFVSILLVLNYTKGIVNAFVFMAMLSTLSTLIAYAFCAIAEFKFAQNDKNNQITSFKEHIEASIQTNIPLIVHSRDAENETFEILNEYKNEKIKILMHCFTGSKEFSEKLTTLNSFFSASGIITFKNTLDLQETFRSIPMDNILIETDSPFLAPVPKRGKKNEPSFIDFTAAKLAEIKEISKSKLIETTTNNFNKLFFNK